MHVYLILRSVADPYDFADRQLILDHVDHEIGYIRPRDFEPETRQMAPSGAAPRHCLASGPPTKRTKSVPNTGEDTGMSRY